MKTLMMILLLLTSPAAVMSGQTPAQLSPAPKADSAPVFLDPFSLLAGRTPSFSETAALVHDQQAVDCLARTVYFEARGEPVEGQMAVASVVLARLMNEEYPDTVCDVVTEARKPGRYRCQFTWWCDGRPDEPKNEQEYLRAKGIAMFAMLLGPQPDSPTHFHTTDLPPQWKLQQVATIGRHVFYN